MAQLQRQRAAATMLGRRGCLGVDRASNRAGADAADRLGALPLALSRRPIVSQFPVGHSAVGNGFSGDLLRAVAPAASAGDGAEAAARGSGAVAVSFAVLV